MPTRKCGPRWTGSKPTWSRGRSRRRPRLRDCSTRSARAASASALASARLAPGVDGLGRLMTAQDLARLGDALPPDGTGALVERPLQTTGAGGEQAQLRCPLGRGRSGIVRGRLRGRFAVFFVDFVVCFAIVISLTTAVFPSGETTTPEPNLSPRRAPDLRSPSRTMAPCPCISITRRRRRCDRAAIAAMLPFLAESPGNPSGAHGAARVTKTALEAAREVVAAARSAPTRPRSSSPAAGAKPTTWRSRARPGRRVRGAGSTGS